MFLVRPVASVSECFAQIGRYAPYRRPPSGCAPTTVPARLHPPRHCWHQQRNGALAGWRRGNWRAYSRRSTLVAAASFEAFALAVGPSSRWLWPRGSACRPGAEPHTPNSPLWAVRRARGHGARAREHDCLPQVLSRADRHCASACWFFAAGVVALLVRRLFPRPVRVQEPFSRAGAGCCHSISRDTCV
jgi:hypothetical protein